MAAGGKYVKILSADDVVTTYFCIHNIPDE